MDLQIAIERSEGHHRLMSCTGIRIVDSLFHSTDSRQPFLSHFPYMCDALLKPLLQVANSYVGVGHVQPIYGAKWARVLPERSD